MANSDQSRDEQKQRGNSALLLLTAMLLCGWIIILIFAFSTTTPGPVLSVATMVATASLLAGLFFGFLFGIPRTLQRSDDDSSAPKTGKSKDDKSTYRPNTNLEQISDWLTKILVGAGLTQISNLRQALADLGKNLATGLGNSDNGSVFAIATFLSFAIDGFLIGYLWTRLHLAGAMQRADLEGLKREIDQIREQSDVDARALALTIKQLHPSEDVMHPSQQELNEAVIEATQNIRAQIFYLAQTVRTENWSEWRKKPRMERTIPVFIALVASDTEDVFHRNHAQLGYALKDQRSPDWNRAQAELSKAIQLRGIAPEAGFPLYEFNRAICAINLDENFRLSEKSAPELRSRVIQDLHIAWSQEYVRPIFPKEATLQNWMKLNDVTQGNF